jgi:hypothetical protein
MEHKLWRMMRITEESLIVAEWLMHASPRLN